ncbi:Alpha/Beta hydrolase protein [Chaetomium strumarium]|uniref:Alpha/Beta hydrolase protein n=1 Tax=Chaetomium strumarium TaxID=1170767 RepID=A0AAJ0H1L6_9PEZI|nr:Alpha/Beta hydrolase protein [Chaetomium strumarium]
MRSLKNLFLVSLLPRLSAQVDSLPQVSPQPSPFDQRHPQQHRISHDGHPQPRPGGVSTRLFATLERTARLVDITYCIGTTGISPPFSCVSRCKDFPALRLVRTWNTGVLLSDSCGYIAIDSGTGTGDTDNVDDDDDDGGVNNSDNDHGLPGEEGQREIVVAFRGTYSITNTIVDLSTVPQEYVPYPAPPEDGGGGGGGKCENCTVHMGFMASWKNAREVVLPALHAAREKYPDYRVHLVGHSLGGAVAALAALEMRMGLGWRDVAVTTFGEPKVGNDKLAEYIDRAFGLAGSDGEDVPYRRVTHVGDPVPLLPLSEWGYASHAGEIHIGKSDLPPRPEDLRLCRGDNDPECMGGAETSDWLSRVLGVLGRLKIQEEVETSVSRRGWFPARLRVWQLLFAHRDYFWRLGLCLPGGDPADWGREKHNLTSGENSGVPEIRDL